MKDEAAWAASEWMMELPLGFRVSGCFGTKHPIKMEREDFVNPHAYNMRTDYYVVSPNSRAYTRGWLRVLWKGACARAWCYGGITTKGQFILFQNLIKISGADQLGSYAAPPNSHFKIVLQPKIQMQDQCFSLYSKAQLIIRIQFYNNLRALISFQNIYYLSIHVLNTSRY